MVETTNTLIVEPNIPFKQRVQSGNYRWVATDLTEEHFPVTPDQIGNWQWRLFLFRSGVLSEEAVSLMRGEGYDAAQIGHTLAFGEKYPDEQRKYTIVGLGSFVMIRGRHQVPVLWFDSPGTEAREIGLRDFDCWSQHVRFLGVRRNV
jgi:hypothetical protein